MTVVSSLIVNLNSNNNHVFLFKITTTENLLKTDCVPANSQTKCEIFIEKKLKAQFLLKIKV